MWPSRSFSELLSLCYFVVYMSFFPLFFVTHCNRQLIGKDPLKVKSPLRTSFRQVGSALERRSAAGGKQCPKCSPPSCFLRILVRPRNSTVVLHLRKCEGGGGL
jgi:hypothetical protein